MSYSGFQTTSAFFVTILWVTITAIVRAELSLPPVLSDHALVQRSSATRIWGRALPDERVLVSLGDVQARTQADAGGDWHVQLDLSNIVEGPHVLSVSGDVSPHALSRSDILVGDVWLCSGQSNMAWRLREADSAGIELGRPENRRIRQFITKKEFLPKPSDALEGHWIMAEGSDREKFTAVGYHFADALQGELDIPIGLLDASVGGTPIEPWMSFDAFEPDAELKAMRDQMLKRVADYPAQTDYYLEEYRKWSETNGRADAPDLRPRPKMFAHPRAKSDAASGWMPVILPASVSETNFINNSGGVTWFRKTISCAPSMAGLYLVLHLGEIQGFYSIYWNGVLMAETSPERPPPTAARFVRLTLPGDRVAEGEAVIAIRVFNPAGRPMIGGAGKGAAFQAGPVSLAGEWLVKSENTFTTLREDALALYPRAPLPPPPPNDRPAYLYNSLIHPLAPYMIRGIIWYQGESNTGRAVQYQRELPLLIADWRARWRQPHLPFYICQLAAYGSPVRIPGTDSTWAELREAQAVVSKSVPDTGQVVLIDLGESADIHPRAKRPVGERLARLALAGTYGRALAPDHVSGPVMSSAEFTATGISLRFSNAGDGLVAGPMPGRYRPRSTAPQELPLIRNRPESQIEGFEIRDEEGAWSWANASIFEKDTVMVASPRGIRVSAVRYAWADYPLCNLRNSTGLPAAPFRTDVPSVQQPTPNHNP